MRTDKSINEDALNTTRELVTLYLLGDASLPDHIGELVADEEVAAAAMVHMVAALADTFEGIQEYREYRLAEELAGWEGHI